MRRTFARNTDETTDGGALDGKALRWFGALVRPYLWRVLVAGVAVVLSGGASLGLPWVSGRVVNAALLGKDTSQLNGVILALVGIFAVSGALDYLETGLLRWTAAD